jgi:transketolase
MPELISMRESLNEALIDLGRLNPDVVVLDADVAVAVKCTAFAAEFPDRFFQIGIAEQNMAGVAAGMATVGLIPFIGTFACFASCRIADQVRTSIAQPGLNVKIMAPFLGLRTGQTGKTHQAIEDIALYRGMPNITIVSPADGPETAQAVHAIARYPGPVYLRITRDPVPVLFGGNHNFEVGLAYWLRKGSDLTFISTGNMTTTAVKAAETLAGEGLECTVLHVPTIKPLDVSAVVEAARTSGIVVTIEEHNIYGGLGGAVTEALSENYPVPVHRIGVNDCFCESGPNEPLMEKYGLTEHHVIEQARAWVNRWRKANNHRK